MSFAGDTKNELARIELDKKCCMLAEIAGFIRVCGSVRLAGGGKFKIVMTTENPAIARRYKKLIKDYFNVETGLEVGQGTSLQKRRSYFITIGPEELSEQILRETGILMVREGMNYFSDGIYNSIIRKKCCRRSYLRGLFLGTGSISNPEKSYHFEIKCATEILGHDVRKLINTFTDIKAKVSIRKNMYVVYIKESEQIKDIMAIMGAHAMLFKFADVTLTKEMRNAANRQSNCDQANIDKAVTAASRHIKAIKKIQAEKGLGVLSEKLQEMAQIRLENPEASIAELGELMDPPLKKSGVNNRLARIEKFAEKL